MPTPPTGTGKQFLPTVDESTQLQEIQPGDLQDSPHTPPGWVDGDPVPANSGATEDWGDHPGMSVGQAIKTMGKAYYDNVLGAVTLPGDVYAGRVDPLSDEAIHRSADLAMNLAGTGTAFAEPGAAGVFGGRLSKTADHQMSNIAEDALSKGADPQDVFEKTGWYQGHDGSMKYEIQDPHPDDLFHDPSLSVHDPSTHNMSDLVNHPELFKAYPDLANTRVHVSSKGGNYWDPTTGEIRVNTQSGIDPAQVVMHEAQHAIQGHEGFSNGSNPEYMYAVGMDKLKQANKWDPALGQFADANKDMLGYNLYSRSAGEVEARNVQSRMGGAFQDLHPLVSEDIPADKVINTPPLQPTNKWTR